MPSRPGFYDSTDPGSTGKGKKHDEDGTLAVQKGMTKTLGQIASEQKAAKPSSPTGDSPLVRAAKEAKKRKLTAGEAGDSLAKRSGY